MKVSAFKVTLETPSGTQVIECDDSTYILDAAEEAGASVERGGWSRRRRGRQLAVSVLRPLGAASQRASTHSFAMPHNATHRPQASTCPTRAALARAPRARARWCLAGSTSPTSPSSMTTRWARALSSPASPTPPATAPSPPTRRSRFTERPPPAGGAAACAAAAACADVVPRAPPSAPP